MKLITLNTIQVKVTFQELKWLELEQHLFVIYFKTTLVFEREALTDNPCLHGKDNIASQI